jgi:3-hydroxyacyl-[acyl-carrier-protein] dehydratase
MRYLLVDRVVRLEANKSIHAIKNVTLSEDIYNEHFFGFPVTPGALQIEAVAQAATTLLEVSASFEKKAFLIMVKNAKFRHFVQPGDQLLIEAHVTSADNDTVQVDGTMRVGDKLVMDAKLVLGLRDAEEFYTPQTKPLVETMYAYLLKDADLVDVPRKAIERVL